MGFSKSLALLTILLVSGTSARTAMTQVDSVQRSVLATRGWATSEEIAGDREILLEIGLTLSNTDKLITTLLDVSNPKSKNYGKWLDKAAADSLVKPSEQSHQAVLKWLQNEGVTKIQSDGTWVRLVTNITTANRLLDAEYQTYERDSVKKIRTLSYSVPTELHDHIDIITPTTFFGDVKPYAPVQVPRVSRRQGEIIEPTDDVQPPPPAGPVRGDKPYFKVDAECSKGITPACVRQLYNVGNYTPLASSGSKVGFSSFLNQSYQYADLKLFQETFKLPYQNATKIFVNKAANSQSKSQARKAAGEANLDVQNIIGLAGPLPTFEFLTGGSPPFVPDLEMTTPAQNTNEPYVPYYQYLLDLDDTHLPAVISNSYGEPEQTVPFRYAQRTCNMIAQLGARGVSVFESSGDTGIGSYCTKNDGSNAGTFLAEFPATCPWITAVGGTQGVSPEVAWADSSGGFSNYFPRPDYQREAVETYFDKHITADTVKYYKPYFNQKGRGFPDISAHSDGPYFSIVVAREMGPSGGTSASSPVWGALTGLLNDARFRAGLPAMGFLNPWLYAKGEEFLVDITQGAARGCDGTNHQNGKQVAGATVIPGAFWNATIGWDPATGLGIPDFQKMVQVAVNEVVESGEGGERGGWNGLLGWGRENDVEVDEE